MIVGSAAGALTGLQFVVIALIAQIRAAGEMSEIRAFGTPTVVHFCTALFISALTVMPWQQPAAWQSILIVCGFAGVVYSIRVVGHARDAKYSPDLEDWLWYTVFPILAHLALAVAAGLFWWNRMWSLFCIAADCLFFLLLGIHNSWDTVTYVTVKHNHPSTQAAETNDAK